MGVNDEFNVIPEVPVEGDSLGEAADSGVEAGEQQSAPVDIFADPRVKNWQSIKDREVAAAKREAQVAAQQAQAALARAAAIERAVSELDPDAGERLTRDAELAYLRQMHQQGELDRQMQQWENETVAWAQSNGLDTSTEDFQQALRNRDRDALIEIHDDHKLEQKVNERLAKLNIQSQQPASTSPAEPAKPRQTAATPPLGGSAPRGDTQLRSEYENKKKALQGRVSDLYELRQEYRSKGLEI
jgi:hypothetical protein